MINSPHVSGIVIVFSRQKHSENDLSLLLLLYKGTFIGVSAPGDAIKSRLLTVL